MRPSLKIEIWNLLSELGRTKSLAQAAERLDMDLPAASRLVSSLEKELGVEILDRKRKPAQIVTKSLELFSEADRIARQYQRLLKMDDVELEFTDESLIAIAEAALARNTGARGLRSIVEKTMNDIMYEVPSNPQIAKVIIHKECITDGKVPEIVLHKKKKTTVAN